jgi:hypothetical protein
MFTRLAFPALHVACRDVNDVAVNLRPRHTRTLVEPQPGK